MESLGKASQWVINLAVLVGLIAFVYALSSGKMLVVADKKFGLVIQAEVKKLVRVGTETCDSREKISPDAGPKELQRFDVEFDPPFEGDGRPSLFLSQNHYEIFRTSSIEYGLSVERIDGKGATITLSGSDGVGIGDCAIMWLAIDPSIVDGTFLPITTWD